jgi:hypothetical protein
MKIKLLNPAQRKRAKRYRACTFFIDILNIFL